MTDEVFRRPKPPGWLVRRIPRKERTEELRARWAADQGKPAPALSSTPSRFGVSLPRLRFLEARED